MKRWIHANTDSKVIFEDVLNIQVEMDLDVFNYIQSAINPDGVYNLEAYREEVADILENEFGFEIMKETVNGKLQRGKCTNRPHPSRSGSPKPNESISIYFNTFYDLINSDQIAEEFGMSKKVVPHRVNCSIFLVISDHGHSDVGYSDHNEYVREQRNNRRNENISIDVEILEDNIIISESIYRDYEKGLQEIRESIKAKIREWRIRFYS